MRIHLITNLFYPDELAGAALFSDLALYLKSHEIDIRVTTTYSYYPSWKISPEDALHPFRKEEWKEIPVKRIRMHVPGRLSGTSRILSDISFLGALLRYGRHDNWIPDVVLTASPMLSQCLAQRFLYPGLDIPRFIIVQDFVVDAALELGIIKFSGLKFLLRALERWSLRSALTLTTISMQMLEKLETIVGKDRRLLLIPNWIHKSIQTEIDHQRAKIPGRKENILLYCGNLGVKQGLPLFLKNFSNCASNWIFKVHGGGAQSESVKSTASKIKGVEIGGVLTESSYVNELLTCSACLVTQSPGVGANFFPSKLLPALATGTPVLAVCEPNSPLGQEVLKGGFGVVIPPHNPKALQQTLNLWSEKPALLADFSYNASLWSKIYNQDKILPQYLRELKSLVSR